MADIDPAVVIEKAKEFIYFAESTRSDWWTAFDYERLRQEAAERESGIEEVRRLAARCDDWEDRRNDAWLHARKAGYVLVSAARAWNVVGGARSLAELLRALPDENLPVVCGCGAEPTDYNRPPDFASALSDAVAVREEAEIRSAIAACRSPSTDHSQAADTDRPNAKSDQQRHAAPPSAQADGQPAGTMKAAVDSLLQSHFTDAWVKHYANAHHARVRLNDAKCDQWSDDRIADLQSSVDTATLRQAEMRRTISDECERFVSAAVEPPITIRDRPPRQWLADAIATIRSIDSLAAETVGFDCSSVQLLIRFKELRPQLAQLKDDLFVIEAMNRLDSSRVSSPASKTTADTTDIRDVLRLLGVEWRTEQRLREYDKLAHTSIAAVSKVLQVFLAADSPTPLPETTVSNYNDQLLSTVIEIVFFGTDSAGSSADWDNNAATWDRYQAHQRQIALTAIRQVTTADHFSLAEATLAAWNIECGYIGSVNLIGPVVSDSAHRCAILAARELWTDFSVYCFDATEYPDRRAHLWDNLIKKWNPQPSIRQCDQVRASLPGESQTLLRALAKPNDAGVATKLPTEGGNGLRDLSTEERLKIAANYLRDHPRASKAEVALNSGFAEKYFSQKRGKKLWLSIRTASGSPRRGFKRSDGTIEVADAD